MAATLPNLTCTWRLAVEDDVRNAAAAGLPFPRRSTLVFLYARTGCTTGRPTGEIPSRIAQCALHVLLSRVSRTAVSGLSPNDACE